MTSDTGNVDIVEGKYQKLFNKNLLGPLYCADDTNEHGDHVVLTNPNKFYSNQGQERWSFECIDEKNQEQKIQNEKYRGPLQCDDETNQLGFNKISVELDINQESEGGNEIWKIVCIDESTQEIKILNKKWWGPLFCDDEKAKNGDSQVFLNPNILFDKEGKHIWTLKNAD